MRRMFNTRRPSPPRPSATSFSAHHAITPLHVRPPLSHRAPSVFHGSHSLVFEAPLLFFFFCAALSFCSALYRFGTLASSSVAAVLVSSHPIYLRDSCSSSRTRSCSCFRTTKSLVPHIRIRYPRTSTHSRSHDRLVLLYPL